MPATSSELPTLSLLHSFSPSVIGSDGYPKERQINRSILLDVSPDREELLSNNPIDEIRERLKLCIHSPHRQARLLTISVHPLIPTTSHWLYRADDLHDTKTTSRNVIISNSLRNSSHEKETVTEDQEVTHCHRNRTSSANNGTVASGDLKCVSDAHKAIWSSRSLSTLDKLISPRPLGPTHTLVVSQRHQDRDPEAESSVKDTLELPINDLLFILNVPNLRTSRKTGRLASVLPRRSYNEMPRVALHVPFLDTFPEVIVYLHTKDKDVLFRQLIPEWLRGIIHPFMSTSSLGSPASTLRPNEDTIRNEDIERSGSQCLSSFWLGLGLNAASIAKGSVRHLLGSMSPILALGHHPSPIKSAPVTGTLEVTYPDDSPKKQNDQRRKAISILAKKIADAYTPIGLEPDENNTELKMSWATTHRNVHGVEINVLKPTADRLDALAANFTHLGYFERTMWLELDMYRDIITVALKLIPPQLANRWEGGSQRD